MTWSLFYLSCFLIGVTLSVLSFVSGTFHLPHFHVHVPHPHVGHAGSAGQHGSDISFVNFGTICAFLAWFGGTGYLLSRYSGIWVWFGFVVASIVGLAGAAVVFWVLGKLLAREHNLDPADYDMLGVLGHVSSPTRSDGVGERVFSQEGVRKAAPIRSEDGRAIDKGVEVVVTRFEKGVAYVRRWDELSGEAAQTASQS